MMLSGELKWPGTDDPFVPQRQTYSSFFCCCCCCFIDAIAPFICRANIFVFLSVKNRSTSHQTKQKKAAIFTGDVDLLCLPVDVTINKQIYINYRNGQQQHCRSDQNVLKCYCTGTSISSECYRPLDCDPSSYLNSASFLFCFTLQK